MSQEVPNQFTLRSLLVLTTAASVLAAIGSMAGRGWVLVLIGLFLALANYLGILAVVQRPRFAQVVLYLTMIPFAVSFFLPAVYVSLGGSALSGWGVCFQDATSYRRLFDARTTWIDLALIAAQYATLMGNVVMAALPLIAHLVVAGKARWYMVVLTVAAAISWSGFASGEAVGYGYFVWCGALTVPVVIVRLKRGQLIVLLVTLVATATFIFIWWESQKRG